MSLTKLEKIIAVACYCDEWTYRQDNETVQSLRKKWGSVCVDCGDRIDIKPLTVEVELERLRTQLNPLAD